MQLGATNSRPQQRSFGQKYAEQKTVNNRKPYLIPKETAEQVLRAAMDVAVSVKVDQLDCSISFHRAPTTKTVEEVLKLGLEQQNTLYHFIYRDQSFLPQEFVDSNGKNPNRNYWDIGLSTLGHAPQYFLWIRLEEDEGNKLVEQFSLKSPE